MNNRLTGHNIMMEFAKLLNVEKAKENGGNDNIGVIVIAPFDLIFHGHYTS